ncbi:phosphatidylserine decarboxylase-domain-containing protein [Piptocephalis cylindrospora]|uniref:Phosphatidylserine decarboxylase proenzyme 2 n=1 Tax=Piptocephalis cylindrospora TaxID=1907219 RepID=A0A4P9Y194_9FUNG|nr:phosphatidylserine decarboxylase-domain-containing protein [Piptocephalis cylindrospora]|eukprot:RKP11570.1 phosphatidylserine decarboxylase-domain-containing protein [Piptocephalis cylindrospora]
MNKVANNLGNLNLQDNEEGTYGRPTPADTIDPDTGRLTLSSRYQSSTHYGKDAEALGIVFIDILSAKNLPPFPNALKTGYDMDPFCVATFGRSSFRTRVLRHTLEATWKERLYFHVQPQDLNFPIRFGIYDYDKFSDNDHVGSVDLPLSTLLEKANSASPNDQNAPGLEDGFITFELPLGMVDKDFLDHKTTLHIRACYLKYTDTRRRFWSSMARQYDMDDNGSMSYQEIETMLDSVGSTLHEGTISSFFQAHGKDLQSGELSFDELGRSLEDYVLGQGSHTPENSGSSFADENTQGEDDLSGGDASGEAAITEQLVRVQKCPVCHRHGMLGKSDLDAVTHIAICSMHDPTQVDRFIMTNFVSESYAQRKWFTKIVNKVSFGGYGVGKNNANILVLDRATGQIVEEKISTYVRLGIRLMYKSGKMSGSRIRSMLESLSRKQGVKYNSPNSRAEIAPFIAFHNLDMSEVLNPLESFNTFNQFFYRKLKPSARPIDCPSDPSVLVSPADARCMFFPTIAEAQTIWIKGQDFTLEKFLGGNTDLANRFVGGSLAIFRLAPQDYHRFHIPADGILSPPISIEGAYYTVNPMAVRSSLDIYGENVRSISVLESPQFGTMAYVSIGAMMVGSVQLTSTPGEQVRRGDEHGYFAFGGSTCVLLFEPGRITFDTDLVENAGQSLETLVSALRCGGERIGLRL